MVVVHEMSDVLVPCLKQRTRCAIVYKNSLATFEAFNECAVGGLEVCPRETAGSKTGEDYELCGSTHAEANAAAKAAGYYDRFRGEAVAYLFGHDWLCRDCQHALADVGVRTFIITGDPS